MVILLQALGTGCLLGYIDKISVYRYGTRLTVSPDISAYFLAGLSGGGASILLSVVGENECHFFVPGNPCVSSHVGSSGLVKSDLSSAMICFRFFHVFFLLEAR